MGYGWGLSVYFFVAPLPQYMAYPTCVLTLMCSLYIHWFCFRWARILECFVL